MKNFENNESKIENSELANSGRERDVANPSELQSNAAKGLDNKPYEGSKLMEDERYEPRVFKPNDSDDDSPVRSKDVPDQNDRNNIGWDK